MDEELKSEGAQADSKKSTMVEAVEEEKPLNKMTAPELKEIAAKIPGVTGVTAMKKEDLLTIIKKHRGIADDEPVKNAVSSISTLKKKLIDLKAQKASARGNKNKKEVDILRRRINRLKKMTRKAG